MYDAGSKNDKGAEALAQKSRGRLHLEATLKPCKPVCIEWQDLSVKVDVEIDGSEAPGICAQKPTEKRAILNKLSGRAVRDCPTYPSLLLVPLLAHALGESV